jgi:ribosome-associated translation inhibitor RaiA
MGKMTVADFAMGFRNEIALPASVKAEMRSEAERRLRALLEGHTDIVGAEVAIEELTGDTTPHMYEVRVVVYMRPESVVAVEKEETAIGALKGSLSALERQIRQYREKLREPWKQP